MQLAAPSPLQSQILLDHNSQHRRIIASPNMYPSSAGRMARTTRPRSRTQTEPYAPSRLRPPYQTSSSHSPYHQPSMGGWQPENTAPSQTSSSSGLVYDNFPADERRAPSVGAPTGGSPNSNQNGLHLPPGSPDASNREHDSPIGAHDTAYDRVATAQFSQPSSTEHSPASGSYGLPSSSSSLQDPPMSTLVPATFHSVYSNAGTPYSSHSTTPSNNYMDPMAGFHHSPSVNDPAESQLALIKDLQTEIAILKNRGPGKFSTSTKGINENLRNSNQLMS